MGSDPNGWFEVGRVLHEARIKEAWAFDKEGRWAAKRLSEAPYPRHPADAEPRCQSTEVELAQAQAKAFLKLYAVALKDRPSTEEGEAEKVLECWDCAGSGTDADAPFGKCRRCNGSGCGDIAEELRKLRRWLWVRDLRNVLTAYGQLASGAISRPDLPGGFEGDIWFGHPIKRALGTHKWVKGTWEEIPDETVSLMELLAEARIERDTYRKTMEAMVEAPNVVASLLTALQAAEQECERLKEEGLRALVLVEEACRRAEFEQARAETAEAKFTALETIVRGYRAATHWIGADSWDGCSDCMDILRLATHSDLDRDMSPDEIANALKELRYGQSALARTAPVEETAWLAKPVPGSIFSKDYERVVDLLSAVPPSQGVEKLAAERERLKVDAVEMLAEALYNLCPCGEQPVDPDGRPIGPGGVIYWSQMGEYAPEEADKIRAQARLLADPDAAPEPRSGDVVRLRRALDDLGYDRVFRAIGDAVEWREHRTLGISVEKLIFGLTGVEREAASPVQGGAL